MKKYSGKMYCFSPPVMLFTFLFEFGAAGYILWRYRMNTLVRLVTATLLTLGTFQLSEYLICGGLGLHGEAWARLGYVSITLLPALGIHIIATIAGKKVPWLVSAAYASMTAFALYFAFTPGAINAQECRPNYAVFDMSHMSIVLYSIYYFGWLLVGALLAWYWARKSENYKALLGMTAGYLLFMVPTVAANLFDPATTAGIPSLMCGFAILLAIDLVAFVLPRTMNVRKKRSLDKKIVKKQSV